jgi:hypothetical protein
LIRQRIGRIATASTVVALLASAMVAGGAGAANTRGVSFGSPGQDGGGYEPDGTLRHGVLSNTTVTAGGNTAITVRLENKSGSTLNKVKIAGGTIADEKPYNPLFPAPIVPSLPSDATYAAVVPLLGTATCDPNISTSFQCDFGNLAANRAVELLIVIAAPATEGDYPYWVTGSWNEGWSSTGSNADYNFAEDDLDVLAASCDNGTASWFLGNQPIVLDDGTQGSCTVSGGPATAQEARVASGANLPSGNGGLATMAIEGSFNVTCPKSYRCLGHTITATILGGDNAPGGVRWTAKWYGTKTLSAVAHFRSDGKVDIIPLTKKFQCLSTPTLVSNCWEEITTSGGKEKPAWIQVIWITDTNGKGGGLF